MLSSENQMIPEDEFPKLRLDFKFNCQMNETNRKNNCTLEEIKHHQLKKKKKI